MTEEKQAKKAAVVLPDPSVGPELLARAIVDVSDAATKLLTSRLHQRAVFLLIQDNCKGKVALATIHDVLLSASDLRKKYVK